METATNRSVFKQRTSNTETPTITPLTRRDLLRGTGVIFGTLSLSSPLALLAPSKTWALEMKQLESHEGTTLLALSKRIYPHATLSDAVYALVVKDLDAKAAKDTKVRSQLSEGVRKLDSLGSGQWKDRPTAQQDRDITSIADTPFFATVRSTAVVSLYSNPLAYAHFGYGAADGDAGYLFEGFNDLSWLPDPPSQDSGPIQTN